MAEQKTNVMRTLEQKKIAYTAHSYPHGDEAVDGVTAAALIGKNPEEVYKTLVAKGAGGGVYVFVIPAAKELDLKKAAKAVREKSVAMIPVRDITALTGYVRGGCSPVGMKKLYPTVFDAAVLSLDTVTVSAGKIGSQVEVKPEQLITLTRASTADLTV
ncbi:MAG: Cys-tRNA(Pro) deacylase [Oscillospiraceae bacterium]|nr:Cys-tRNA(Pro) deacylase [Oscillospiraceae bacterium]